MGRAGGREGGGVWEGGPMRGLATVHVISGPMRGLEKTEFDGASGQTNRRSSGAHSVKVDFIMKKWRKLTFSEWAPLLRLCVFFLKGKLINFQFSPMLLH